MRLRTLVAATGLVLAAATLVAPADATVATSPLRARATTIATTATFVAIIGADGTPYLSSLNPATFAGTLEPMSGLPRGVTAKAVAAGQVAEDAGPHVLVLGSDGRAYGLGDNFAGQITGSTVQRSTLRRLTGLPSGVRATAVAAGSEHSLVLGSDGVAYATGNGEDGATAQGGTSTVRTLTPMKGLSPGERAVGIAAGPTTSFVIGSTGQPYGAGQGIDGELAGDSIQQTLQPMVGLPITVDATAISGGRDHTVVLGSNGVAYATGRSEDGKITGDVDRRRLTRMRGLPDGVTATAVAAGREHSLVLGSDGTPYATGSNQFGQQAPTVDLGETVDLQTELSPMRYGPFQPSGTRAVEVAAGPTTSLVRTRNGYVFGAGKNDSAVLGGVLGDSTTTLAAVSGQRLVAVTRPRISGTATVGRTLEAGEGRWSPAPVAHGYQWYRNGSKITGATSTTYRLKAADRGKRITVRVSADSSPFAMPGSSTSPPTAKVR